jgi:hypothetical protein
MADRSLAVAYVDKLQFRRLQHWLTGKNLLGPELKRVFEEMGTVGETRVQSRAPKGKTLQLVGGVSHVVEPGRFPTFVKITADAANRGFRYPWALQASRKIKYTRRGPPRMGRPTRRWFTGAVPYLKRELRKRLGHLSGRVERKWRR